MQEERKAPIANGRNSAGLKHARSSSKNNLADNREERKEMRAGVGAQLIMGSHNTARQQPRAARGGINEFNNAPQYTKQGHNLIKNNPGFQRPPATGVRGNTPVGGAAAATGGAYRQVSRGRGPAGQPAPYATGNARANIGGGQGPKIATTNTRLQRF